MTTLTGIATLTGIGQTVVEETTFDTINRLPRFQQTPAINFFHGIRVMEGSDTTFSPTFPWTITFASSDISGVHSDDIVRVIDENGIDWFAIITNVVPGTGTITIDGWEHNETAPTAISSAPADGLNAVINLKPVQFAYTVGSDVYAPPGYVLYTVGDTITFNAYSAFKPPRYAAAYRWDLGDGTILTGPVVSHTYISPSLIRRVKLEVLNDLADGYVVSAQIYVIYAGVLLTGLGIIIP